MPGSGPPDSVCLPATRLHAVFATPDEHGQTQCMWAFSQTQGSALPPQLSKGGLTAPEVTPSIGPELALNEEDGGALRNMKNQVKSSVLFLTCVTCIRQQLGLKMIRRKDWVTHSPFLVRLSLLSGRREAVLPTRHTPARETEQLSWLWAASPLLHQEQNACVRRSYDTGIMSFR